MFGTCASTRHAARGGPCLQSLHACTHAQTHTTPRRPAPPPPPPPRGSRPGNTGGCFCCRLLRASATDRCFQSIQPATKLIIPPGRAPARSIGRPRSKLETAGAFQPGRGPRHARSTSRRVIQSRAASTRLSIVVLRFMQVFAPWRGTYTVGYETDDQSPNCKGHLILILSPGLVNA